MSSTIYVGDAKSEDTQKKYKKIKVPKFIGPIGFVKSLLYFITGNFLELDNGNVDGLLDRQKNELANIALVGALLMTITFSYLPPIIAWEDDWLKGAFAFTTSFCNCMVVCAVALSISMLLALNILKDDHECKVFFEKLGFYELVPFQTLWAAISTFGFIVGTLQYYKLINYDNWFVIVIVVTYLPAMVIVPFTIYGMMTSLTGVRKEYESNVTHCTKNDAETYLKRYINEKFHGNPDTIESDNGREWKEFVKWVKDQMKTEFISRRGVVHLKTSFEECLGALEY